jgi:hypothetical protein
LTIGSLTGTIRRVFADVSALPRWARLVAAVFLALACATAYPRGGIAAGVAAILCAAIVTAIAWAIADPADRRWVLLWVLLAMTVRELLVGAIDLALLRQGALWYAPDEHIYIEHAYAIWQHWLDPAAPFAPDPYSASLYVHWIARIYELVGSENLVLVKLANTTLAMLSCLMGYRVMRNLGMPGVRWALVLLLFFPSMVLWSALTLKDAYVIFFLFASLWTASEFIRSRNWLWLIPAVLVLEPLETVRLYMLATGALALLAVPFALKTWRDRLFSAAALLASVYLVFAIVQPFNDLGPNVFYIPIFLREAAAQGARSSFVEPLPVIQGEAGQRFQVNASSGATPPPGQTPRIVTVQAGTNVIFEGASQSPAPAGRATPAVIRPGDIVVIAGGSPTPSPGGAPTTPPKIVTIEPEANNTVGLSNEVDPDQTSFQGSLATNVRHLPIGITYTLLAPFPWSVTRTLEQLATIPEMFIWYACLVLALAGFVVLLRRRDLRYAHGVAMIIGLTIVLSLISANVGTLVRSRAMLIPYVLILSGVGIDWLLRRYSRFNPLRSRE